MSAAQLPTIFAQNAGDAVNWGIGPFVIFLIGLGLIGFVIWLWALMDAIRNPALDDTMRIVWALVIVLTGIVGVSLYAVIGRSKTLARE